MRPAKTQISQSDHQSSLTAQKLATRKMYSEDPDQSVWIPGLICVIAFRRFCHDLSKIERERKFTYLMMLIVAVIPVPDAEDF